MKRNSNFVNMFVIILITLLFLALFCSIFIPVNFLAVSHWLSPIKLLGCSFGLLVILVEVIKICKHHPRLTVFIQRLLLVALLILQFYIAVTFVDYGRADSFFIRNQADMFAHHIFNWQHYFKIYPNNIFCTILITFLIKLSIGLHLSSPWVFINIIQFIWLDLGLFSSLFLLKKWNLSFLKPLLILIWILAAPLAGYALFVYTDIWVLPIPLMITALLSLKCNSTFKEILKSIVIIGLLVFSAKIKGNFWILVIAFVLAFLICSIKKHQNIKIQYWAICFIGVFIIFSGMSTLFQKETNYSSNDSLPVTHWIAMSSEPNTHGDYVKHQTIMEIQLPSKKAREKSDIKQISANLKEMGVIGTLNHCLQKLQLLMSSGTFGYQRLTKQWQNAPLWFYKNKARIQAYTPNFIQIGHICLLIGTIIFLGSTKADLAELILELFMIGIITFHSIIWESEERYGLPLLPILILLGLRGINKLAEVTENHHKVPLIAKVSGMVLIMTLIIGSVLNLPLEKGTYISGQNIGSYLVDEKIKVFPFQTIKSEIYLPVCASELKLDPVSVSKKSEMVNVKLIQNNQYKSVNINLNQTDEVPINSFRPGKIKIIITNMTNISIALEVGKSFYTIGDSLIKGYHQTYLQYQIYQKNK